MPLNINPYKIGQSVRRAAYKVGQAARTAVNKVGGVVGGAVRKVTKGTALAEKVVGAAGAVRDKVRGINEASGGLLEEGVRALPFGNNVVRGAKAFSKGVDRAGTVLRKVRRGAETVERVRTKAQKTVNQFT